MLRDFDGGKPGLPVTQVYFAQQYAVWQSRLNRYQPLAFPSIWHEIDGHFSTAALHPSKQLLTMTWIPGPDWTGTVYDPIYYALAMSHDASAKFLGLIFMDVAIHRDEWWGSGHYELRGEAITGRTYFLLGAGGSTP